MAQTRAALERIRLEIEAASPAAAKAGATVLGRDMIARAPRNTGRLASSIRVESDGKTAHVGATVPYARFVEFGTRYMPAQPFEEDAANNKGGIVAAIAAVLKAVIH